MKFFHLADLHFGKNIHGYSMIEMGDQRFWIDRVLEKALELKPDAIVIAGDVYDRAVPSKEAVQLLDEFLTKIAVLDIPVLMIAGNHDSGSRLAFADKLLCHQKVYIAGEACKEVKCITLQDQYGPVHFWLIPYIFPAMINVLLEREDIKDYDSAMRALLEAQSINFQERNVVISHQFIVAGAEKPAMGGSETTVGGIGQIDASVFQQFDYAALGHIHNAQKMGNENIRYAGSPLCYHFSETGQNKGLTVVEIKEKGECVVSVVPIPVLHKMLELCGTMEELLAAKVEKNSYVRAVIKQEVLPPQAVEQLRKHFSEQNAILMEVVRAYENKKSSMLENKTKNVRTSSLEELFEDFYSYLHEGEFPETHLKKLISFVAEQTRNSTGDESMQEKKQDVKQLIEYAANCKKEENE